MEKEDFRLKIDKTKKYFIEEVKHKKLISKELILARL